MTSLARMTTPAPAYALELRQRFTPLQNRYDLVGIDAAGVESPLGYAEQKRFSLKEKVTFWAGADRSQVAVVAVGIGLQHGYQYLHGQPVLS